MPNIATVLKQEISRLARKEAKALTAATKKAGSQYRRDIAELKRQVKALRWMMESSEWISTRKYCKLNCCSDETSRKDFLQLLELGLIKAEGSGRSTQYLAPWSLRSGQL